MFRSNSRYAGLPTITVAGPNEQEVSAIKLRILPQTGGVPTLIKSGNQLDVISERRYRNGTGYWHIADANTELEAGKLTGENGRVIIVPER